MKRLILIFASLTMLLTPVGAAATLFIERAQAADPQCTNPGRPILAFDRRRNCGYFNNNYDPVGDDVRLGGVPGWVNTAGELIQLVQGDLNSSNAQRVTGAQFIILNMIGRPAGPPKSVSAAELQDWKDRVNSYASTSENGSRSTGSNGRIDWFVSLHTPCGIVNTYYQDDENDVAPFTDTPSNSRCNDPSYFTNFIIFRDTGGNIKYMIRRECMNPVGNLESGLDKPKALNYNLEPGIGLEVNGDSSATAAEVGDTVRFVYQATNTGSDPSPSVSCTIYANIHNGYFPTPPTPTSGSSPPGYLPPLTSCPKSFTPGLNSVAAETVTVTATNQTVCRSLFVSPASPAVASRGYEVCLPVANKPYVRAFGGDVMAGSGLADTFGACVPNLNAAAVGWSKRSAGNFAGAGTQYAGFAMKLLQDFATTLGDPSGGPTGLSFTNTAANPNAGNYGGNFDRLPCLPDYYAAKPGSTQPFPPSFNLMTTGAYAASGNTTLHGGLVDVNEQISVFIEGDVFVNDNILVGSPAASWPIGQMPTFRLVVKGNIYVSSTVTQLDGLYVAQKNDAGAGGRFYTCATSFGALPLDGSLFSTCNNKLTVNGSVAADSIHLMRTHGSLGQSSAGETSAANQAAEVFNYSPALWLRQPPESGPTPDYDAIISLPPIL
ncbi:MAG: hypothetical protein ACREGD_01725 [Candidatus Saccharimonadales bacterium]